MRGEEDSVAVVQIVAERPRTTWLRTGAQACARVQEGLGEVFGAAGAPDEAADVDALAWVEVVAMMPALDAVVVVAAAAAA